MEDKKIILYDSPEAATFKTGISGWVDAGGRFWGKDEHMARYSGCTHVLCQGCGAPSEKGWTHCEGCRVKRSDENYQALPFKKWHGEEAICTWDGHHYFFNEEDLIEFLYENEFNGSDVQLVFCEPIEYREIDYNYWGDDAHEDWEPPKKLVEAVEKVNDLIRELKPHSYTAGKIRTSYDYTYKPEE